MKQFKLVWQSFYRIKAAALILVIVLTFSLIVLSYILGLVRFYNFSQNLLKSSKLENSVYLKLAFDESRMEDDIYTTFASFDQIYDQIRAWQGVKRVLALKSYGSIKIGSDYYQAIILDANWSDHLPIPIEGGWFSASSSEVDQAIPAILGGTMFSSTKIDSIIAGRVGSSQEPISLKVCGKVKFPGYTPSLSNGSTQILTDYLYTDSPVILMWDNPSLLSVWDAATRQMITENAWVVFDDDLSEQNKLKLLSRLNKFGSYSHYEDIIRDSREAHNVQLKQILPIPLFLFFSSLASLFSLASLYVIRNTRNQVLYFFCGCSRLRSLLILIQGLSMIFFLPVILTSAFIMYYPSLREISWLRFNRIILDETVALYILLFVLILLVLLALQPVIINRKRSPLELFRRITI